MFYTAVICTKVLIQSETKYFVQLIGHISPAILVYFGAILSYCTRLINSVLLIIGITFPLSLFPLLVLVFHCCSVDWNNSLKFCIWWFVTAQDYTSSSSIGEWVRRQLVCQVQMTSEHFLSDYQWCFRMYKSLLRDTPLSHSNFLFKYKPPSPTSLSGFP